MHLNFNQAISKEKPYTYNNNSKSETSQALINFDLEQNIRRLKSGRSKLLNELIRFSNIYANVNPSQLTLGNKCDLSRKTINKYLKEFQVSGILVSEYRKHTTKRYFLNEIFFNPIFRKRLGDQYPYLRWNPKEIFKLELLSKRAYDRFAQREKVTLYKYNKLLPYGNNNLLIYNQAKEDINIRSDIHLRENSKKAAYNSLPKSKTMIPNQEKEEIVVSAYVAHIAQIMNLTEEQEIKLSAYPDSIVKTAFSKIQGKQLTQPFNYMFTICSKESSKSSSSTRNIVRMSENKSAQDKPMAVRDERFQTKKILNWSDTPRTAMEIAKEIRRLIEIDWNVPVLNIDGQGMREKMISNTSLMDFLPSDDPNERIALRYIDTVRIKYGHLPRIRPECESRLAKPKEIIPDNIINQSESKIKSQAKFVSEVPPVYNPFDFEEIYE